MLLKVLDKICDRIEENKQFLTDLDAAIGDADHGINLDRGFKAVKVKMPQFSDKDIGTILKDVGMALVSTVGGAAGPLYGTMFMRMGQAASKKTVIDREDVLNMFEQGLNGIKTRGKAVAGDKTMIDALEPALNELKKSIETGLTLPEAFNRATNAAYEGVEFTKGIAAKKGRASYLGKRSIGHQDPGATSSYIILKAVSEVLNLL